MTPTAGGKGIKYPLICGTGMLVFWCAIAGALWLILEQPLLKSFGIAFAILWAGGLVVVLGTWLYGRLIAGNVMVDCGPFSGRIAFLKQALLCLIVGLMGGLASTEVSKTLAIAVPVFAASLAGYWIFMASGRLQVRQRGIWLYWGLLRWDKIDSYHWVKDSTLVVKRKSFFGLHSSPFPVPAEHRQAVDEVLANHCSVEPTA